MDQKKSLEERWDDFKAWAGRKKEELNVWFGENKEVVMVCAPVIIGGGLELIKVLVKRSNINREEQLKTNFIYDRHSGHYYELKRQPKSRQWIEIDRRKDEGERVGDILKDMRLLK